MLLFTAIIAAWLAIQVNKAQKQRAAVAAIERAGGVIYYDWMADYWERTPPRSANKHLLESYLGKHERTYSWLRSMVGEEYFQTVRWVSFPPEHYHPKKHIWPYSPEVGAYVDSLPEPSIYDPSALATHLKDLPDLESLSVEGIQLQDGDLRHLAGLRNLTDLTLKCPQISDAGIIHLARLTRLKQLNLSDTAVSDKSVPLLLSFQELEWLAVGDGVTFEGVTKLRAGLPKCIVWSPKSQ